MTGDIAIKGEITIIISQIIRCGTVYRWLTSFVVITTITFWSSVIENCVSDKVEPLKYYIKSWLTSID